MKKVLLIYGGLSSEHDVSIKSAEAIMDNIDKEKYDLKSVKITKNNQWISENKEIDNIISFIKQFDVVFPITHGNNGEDGKLQGMLDLFNIKYVGCKTSASVICMDKEYSKLIFKDLNLNVVPYEIYNNKINIEYPIIIKPANGGSSIGISKANNKKEAKLGIKEAYKYDNKIIIEKFIKMQELECAVLEDKKLIVSEVGEIKSANEFYDYEAKYENNESKTLLKANIPNKIKKQIQEIAKDLFKKLNLNSFARFDFFYDNENLYINEINTIPGFTDISMFPKLIMNEGYTFKDLITILIENAK